MLSVGCANSILAVSYTATTSSIQRSKENVLNFPQSLPFLFLFFFFFAPPNSQWNGMKTNTYNARGKIYISQIVYLLITSKCCWQQFGHCTEQQSWIVHTEDIASFLPLTKYKYFPRR